MFFSYFLIILLKKNRGKKKKNTLHLFFTSVLILFFFMGNDISICAYGYTQESVLDSIAASLLFEYNALLYENKIGYYAYNKWNNKRYVKFYITKKNGKTIIKGIIE